MIRKCKSEKLSFCPLSGGRNLDISWVGGEEEHDFFLTFLTLSAADPAAQM